MLVEITIPFYGGDKSFFLNILAYFTEKSTTSASKVVKCTLCKYLD